MPERINIKIPFLLALVLPVLATSAQEDNVGPGRALSFNGTTDYVDLGDRYDDIELPVTVSAWIHLSSTVTNWAPVFVSQDNANLYNGFWLIVQPGLVGIGYGDGQGENLPLYRRSKTAFVDDISERWVHVTGVIRDKLDMDIYVNGINVGGDYSGSSNLPMSSTSVDVVRIGRWHSNGTTFHFKGMIDEVRLWNRTLSRSEVRSLLCSKVIGTENGLVGNWTFNEIGDNIIRDKSTNGFDATLIGGQRVWSGAPIGDDSKYIYTSSWEQATLSAVTDEDSISVTNITGNPQGIHVYRVLEGPSQSGGLPDDCIANSYFGVFTDSYLTSTTYDVNYKSGQVAGSNMQLYTRPDNSKDTWDQVDNNGTTDSHLSEGQVYRGEFIRTNVLKVDLGEDMINCDQEGVLLNPGPVNAGTTITWNTGDTTPTLFVTTSGRYTVTMQNNCGTAKDDVEVEFHNLPPSFDLQHELDNLCKADEIVLTPTEDLSSFDVSWSNGSIAPTLTVTEPGTYTLTASNVCGERKSSATIGYTPVDSVFIPNIITPGGDNRNQNFEIRDIKGPLRLTIYNRWGRIVYRTTDYQNDWDGEDLPAGVYYYLVSGGCVGERKGSLSILRH